MSAVRRSRAGGCALLLLAGCTPDPAAGGAAPEPSSAHAGSPSAAAAPNEDPSAATSTPKPADAPPAAPEPESAPRRSGRFVFVDVTAEAGLAGFQQVNGTVEKPFLTETVGGGVALADFDADGDLDAYLSNGSSHEPFAPGTEPRDALYWNDGNGRFRDGTEAAGLGDTTWTCGAYAVDLDGDGFPEIYLTNLGPNVLYKNRGDGTFEDVTERAGVGDPRWSTGAGFLDYDRDGDLDLYVSNYVDFDLEEMRQNDVREEYHGVRVLFGPRGMRGEHDAFYVNQGDGTFRDASTEVGIAEPATFGFQCLVFDVDLDGWLDLYVANDSDPNHMWRNDQKGKFVDIGPRLALALNRDGAAQASMGACVGDYDGDLQPDIFVTNFAEDYFTLYRAGKGGFYNDVSHRTRLAAETRPYLGWGCAFADLDADGDEDLFAVCGHVYPQVDLFPFGKGYRQERLLFENTSDGRFERVDGGPGFAEPQAGRGSAVGDVDGDGDPDLLIGNIDGTPMLLRNDSPAQGNRLVVELVGRGANRDAIGARVLGRCGERRFLQLVGTWSGFLSTNDRRLYLGLGEATRLDELVITWPEGDEERVEGLAAGQVVTIAASRGVVASKPFGKVEKDGG